MTSPKDEGDELDIPKENPVPVKKDYNKPRDYWDEIGDCV